MSKLKKTDPYNRVLAVVHLLGGQFGSQDLKANDPRIDNAIEVVKEIERKLDES
jgi:hypothetical protein